MKSKLISSIHFKDILRQYPYHVDALFHLSDVSRIQDDTPTAVDLMGML